MTTTRHDQPSAQAQSKGRASRVLVTEMWASLAIAAMWMAVLFVGVFGNDMTFRSVDSSFTTMPAGVGVALFAAIGTASVAKRVFGRRSD